MRLEIPKAAIQQAQAEARVTGKAALTILLEATASALKRAFPDDTSEAAVGAPKVIWLAEPEAGADDVSSAGVTAESHELHLAIGREIVSAKAKGEELSYFEAARRVELAEREG